MSQAPLQELVVSSSEGLSGPFQGLVLEWVSNDHVTQSVLSNSSNDLNNKVSSLDVQLVPKPIDLCDRNVVSSSEAENNNTVVCEQSSGECPDPIVSAEDELSTSKKPKSSVGRDGNLSRPIYRLSMRLSPMVFSTIDIPNADGHGHVDKSGYLHKLCGRTFPYLQQWKRRYCVLSKGFLFYYENEDSKGADKASGVIDLKYFDQVAEAPVKESKKATNVFVITSYDRSFFDPGRHLLSAETLTDMNDWIHRLKDALELIKNNNRSSAAFLQKESARIGPIKPKDHQQSHYQEDKMALLSAEESVDSKRIRREKFNQMDITKKSLDFSQNCQLPALSFKKEIMPEESCSQGSKPLESITKNRPKGPVGRRAPNARRTLKQRASSLNALQHGQEDGAALREKKRVNLSIELLEAVKQQEPSSKNPIINTSHPALAYRYSSDEDDPDEVHLDPDCFLGISASALNRTPPSPPPRTCSYNMEGDGIVEGESLKDGKDSRRNSAVFVHHCERPEELLDYRSLPRPRTSKRMSSGRSSPAMDMLENHFMNQSVQHMSVDDEVCCPSDDRDAPSEGSTFKGTATEHCEDKRQCFCSAQNLENISSTLLGLSGALEHMQHHTASLDSKTKTLEKDMKEVLQLPSAAENLRTDLNQLAESVAFISQEASRARIDLISQRQETERIHHEATTALASAEKSRQELQKTKKEYEVLIKELHSLISSLKDTLHKQEYSPKEEDLPIANDKSDKHVVDKVKNDTTKSSDPKKGSTKLTGYQSFFQRPSSLIYGLTSKGIGKSVSFSEKEKRDKQSNNKHESDTKKKSKHKSEKQQSSKDKKSKTSKRQLDGDRNEQTAKGESYVSSRPATVDQGTQSENSTKQRRYERIGGTLSIDDLPMMDDHSICSDVTTVTDKSNVAYGISRVSINVSPPNSAKPGGKYSLEKSSSSPVVPNRSVLNNKNSNLNVPFSEFNKSPSSSPSPDSFRVSNGTKQNKPRAMRSVANRLNRKSLDETPLNNVHLNTSKSQPVTSNSIGSRPGVFAISRQSSSPNIPVQRQNSAPLYPIQRQHSLGTVPEEGHLPRQESLMSVPEYRPIVDQTLPLSPTASMISFPLSQSPSDTGLANTNRSSMELVTGPVISGSSYQEATARQLPPASEFHGPEIPIMTSSLKKKSGRKSIGIVV